MPAPASATYSVAALVAAHTAFRNLIDGGAGAGFVRVRSAADVLLAQIPLTDPCGTINGTTGRLTITASGPDASADADGTAAYCEVCDSTGAVHLALPAQQGTAAVPGYAVLNTTSILAGGAVQLVSLTVG